MNIFQYFTLITFSVREEHDSENRERRGESIKVAVPTHQFLQIKTEKILFKTFFFHFQPLGETFEFPKLIPETIKEKEEKELNDTQKSLKDIQKKFLEKNKNRHGLPGWYSI